MLDLCFVSIDRSLSNDVLRQAKRAHVLEVLDYILAHGDASPTKLAAVAGVQRNHMSNILRLMESTGLVRKVQVGRWHLGSLGFKGQAARRALIEDDDARRRSPGLQPGPAGDDVAPSDIGTTGPNLRMGMTLILVQARDKRGVIRDIASAFFEEGMDIQASGTAPGNGTTQLWFIIASCDRDQVEHLRTRLEAVPAVKTVGVTTSLDLVTPREQVGLPHHMEITMVVYARNPRIAARCGARDRG